MAARVLAALVLILLGSLLGVPIAILLGTVALLLEVVHCAWARTGLTGVRYRRELGRPHVAFGDELPLAIEVWNRRRLPLAWLRADDDASPGVEVRERDLVTDETKPAVLRNAWTLRPYERVVRRFHVSARPARRPHARAGRAVDRRPVRPACRDRGARGRSTRSSSGRGRSPPPSSRRSDRWGDLDRAHQGLVEDPSRFAGVRPYAPGDPVRRVHARTSARLDQPMLKRFEPSRDREVARRARRPDLRRAGLGPRPHRRRGRGRCTSSPRLARAPARPPADLRSASSRRATRARRRGSRRCPSRRRPGRRSACSTSSRGCPSTPRCRSTGSSSVAARSTRGPGPTVLVLTARDPRPFAPRSARLERRGAHVVVVACGRQPRTGARPSARRLGFVARRAVMDGHWRTADRLVIAP